jgi:hypothetical protein
MLIYDYNCHLCLEFYRDIFGRKKVGAWALRKSSVPIYLGPFIEFFAQNAWKAPLLVCLFVPGQPRVLPF